jgi:hypothetical protein
MWMAPVVDFDNHTVEVRQNRINSTERRPQHHRSGKRIALTGLQMSEQFLGQNDPNLVADPDEFSFHNHDRTIT